MNVRSNYMQKGEYKCTGRLSNESTVMKRNEGFLRNQWHIRDISLTAAELARACYASRANNRRKNLYCHWQCQGHIVRVRLIICVRCYPRQNLLSFQTNVRCFVVNYIMIVLMDQNLHIRAQVKWCNHNVVLRTLWVKKVLPCMVSKVQSTFAPLLFYGACVTALALTFMGLHWSKVTA